jgi:hypothetical protein
MNAFRKKVIFAVLVMGLSGSTFAQAGGDGGGAGGGGGNGGGSAGGGTATAEAVVRALAWAWARGIRPARRAQRAQTAPAWAVPEKCDRRRYGHGHWLKF